MHSLIESRDSVLQETTMTLREVPDYLPRRQGRKVHHSTIFRWVTKGARGRVLESILVGGIRYTSVEALHRFFRVEVSTAKLTPPLSDHQLAEQALREAGL